MLKDFVFNGLSAGVVAAVLLAVPDALFSNGSLTLHGCAATVALLSPIGAFFGLCLAVIAAARPKRPNPGSAPASVFRTDTPEVSLRVLFWGLLAVAGFLALQTACYFFATAFHHPGLAAFALLLFLGAASLLTVVLGPFLVRTTVRQLMRIQIVRRQMPRPLFSACFSAGAALGILVSAVRIGPKASGSLGLLGVLRTVGGPALVTCAAMVSLTAFLSLCFLKHLKRLAPIACIAAVLTATLGALAVPSILHRSPETRIALIHGKGAAAWAFRTASRFAQPATASAKNETTQN